MQIQKPVTNLTRDGPLEKLWGGGRSTKKISCKGKWSEKQNHAQGVARKKVPAHGKNIPSREMLTKKKIMQL